MTATVTIMLALLAVLLCLGAFSAVRHMSAQVDHGPEPVTPKPAVYEDV